MFQNKEWKKSKCVKTVPVFFRNEKWLHPKEEENNLLPKKNVIVLPNLNNQAK